MRKLSKRIYYEVNMGIALGEAQLFREGLSEVCAMPGAHQSRGDCK